MVGRWPDRKAVDRTRKEHKRGKEKDRKKII
jgi:hypothetical protein